MRKLKPVGAAAMLGLAVTLAGCQPRPKAVDPADARAAALEAAGFAQGPVVGPITAGSHGAVVVSGQAVPDGRVRVTFADPERGSDQVFGFTADAQGHFRAEVPSTEAGGIYTVAADDAGRLIDTGARLFVPPGRPDKTIVLRPGSPSMTLHPGAVGLAVADYDAAGAFGVSGEVAADTDVTVMVNDEIRARIKSDDQGAFSAVTQIPPPGPAPQTVRVVVQAGAKTFQRDIIVTASPPVTSDHVTPAGDGWRIDWMLPGGGVQSTLVF